MDSNNSVIKWCNYISYTLNIQTDKPYSMEWQTDVWMDNVKRYTDTNTDTFFSKWHMCVGGF